MQTSGNNNPIAQNNSTHVKYSFSKTPRFGNNNSICPQAFYTVDSQLSKRRTSLGYGKKVQFSSFLPSTPASNRYRIQSTFETGKGGNNFGCARQKSPDRSYLVPQLYKHPGVGQYENKVETRMPQEYSIHGKTIDVIEKDRMCHHTPGPGTYQTNDFQNSTGKQSISKYGGSKFGKIEPNKKRFPVIKQSPGPSSYQNVDGQADRSHYALSHHTGKGGRVFNRQARFTSQHWRPSANPGPGNYQSPSEFGQTISNFHNN